MKQVNSLFYTIIYALALLVLLVACGANQEDGHEVGTAPLAAPTTHPFFNAAGTASREAEGFSESTQGTAVESAASENSLPASSNQAAGSIRTVSYVVYNDQLNSNWQLENSSGITYEMADSNVAHNGTLSISATPRINYGGLLFTIREDANVEFPREQVIGLSFWLYSGEGVIETDDLLVQVQGSNALPHWDADDDSVQNTEDLPAFSATRLYYLNINNTIPPETWVKVELFLDDREFDADFAYLTGFAIFNDEMFLQTYYVDDVTIMMVSEEATEVVSEMETAVSPPTQNPSPNTTTGLETAVTVTIDTTENVHPISPLIYGLSGGEAEVHAAIQPTLLSWGGNPSTRYNWKLGNAWNAAKDYFYLNGNYGVADGVSSSDEFAAESLNGKTLRLVVPTLGWVAKDTENCSFPLENGECGDADGADCATPGEISDPTLTSVPSDPDTIKEWLLHLSDEGYDVRFVSLDNEPELWGYTHYDVHPNCTTYEEILGKHITYATAVREVAPEAEITGPTICCWFSYWKTAPGPADPDQRLRDFLPWFLENVRTADETSGQQTLDVLDVHYYPQGVFSNEVDAETAAWRLRSTNSLWDAAYVDESWIGDIIFFIPRMKRLIDEHYPDLKLGISEWNWGADTHMSGALAIADVLGIYGREDVYFAAYWRNPPPNSPGQHAFEMYSNYDGAGQRFGDTSVATESSNTFTLGSYAAIDSKSGDLHIMLINKNPDEEVSVTFDISNFTSSSEMTQYRYDESNPNGIVSSQIEIDLSTESMNLPAYSITLLVVEGS